jgi:hypothetical protein
MQPIPMIARYFEDTAAIYRHMFAYGVLLRVFWVSASS